MVKRTYKWTDDWGPWDKFTQYRRPTPIRVEFRRSVPAALLLGVLGVLAALYLTFIGFPLPRQGLAASALVVAASLTVFLLGRGVAVDGTQQHGPQVVGVGLLALELGISGGSTTPLVLLGLLAAAAMTAGGLWASQGVMRTLAFRVTDLGAQEGMTANLTNSVLVGGASLLGLPLSTTQVSGAALVGAAQASGSGRVRWPVVREIALAWLVTIPGAALLAALFWLGAQGVIALV